MMVIIGATLYLPNEYDVGMKRFEMYLFFVSAGTFGIKRIGLKKFKLLCLFVKAILFYLIMYSGLPFDEYKCEFKSLQTVSPFVFWTSTFVFDGILHILIMTTLISGHFLFDRVYHMFHRAERGKIRSIVIWRKSIIN